MKKINEAIARIEYSIGTVMLISIIILVFASALLRVVDLPIVWSVDASQLLFVWISMIGADLALKKRSHMGVDLLVRKFPLSLQKIIALVTYILCIAFVVFIAYWGVRLCIMNYLRKYQTLKISYSFATAAIPTIAIFMLSTLVEQTQNLLRGWKDPSVVQ
ncbi:MAG: TRAP transporter small permease [Sphaerochaeta sp.]|nr:TRAP transporter small permease [Sphaerochaeta sp.]